MRGLLEVEAATLPVLSSVSITGGEYQGGTLTANYTLSAGSPSPSASYQWKRGVTDVGTDSPTYSPVAGDVGSTITCDISVTNASGSDNDTAGPTGTIGVFPSFSSGPTLSGTAQVGQTLTCTATGAGTPSPTLAYQWQTSPNGTDSWSNISGANSSTYLATVDELNEYLRCDVDVTNVHGTAEDQTASSAQVAAAPSDAYIENGFSPDTVVDFAGIKNSGTEYYRSVGVDSDFDTMTTFTRAGNATMVDSDGKLKWAPHTILTAHADNLQTGWYNENTTDSGTTLTSTTAASTFHRIRPFSAPSMLQGVKYKFRMKLTPGTHDYVYLTIGGSTNRYALAVFDLTGSGSVSETSTGATSGTIHSTNITADGSGGFDVEIVASDAAAAPATVKFGFAELSTGNTITLSGDVTWTPAGTETFDAEEINVQRADLGGVVDNPDTTSGYVPGTGSALYLPRRNAYRRSGGAWVNGGILLETAARTNLCISSRDFAGSNWTSVSTTETADQVGIDGETNSAHTLTDTSSGAIGYIRPTTGLTIAADTEDYTMSAFFKKTTSAASFPGMAMIFTGGGVTAASISINTDNGTAQNRAGISQPADTIEVEDAGDYWRVSMTKANANRTALECWIVPSATTDITTAWDATLTGSVVADQCDIVKAPVMTSPIPTVGASATRVAETLIVDTAAVGTDVSWQLQGRLSRASGDQITPFYWYQDINNYYSARIADSGVRNEFYTGGTQAVNTSATVTAGYDQSFNIAGRIDGSTALQAATAGTAATANTTSIPATPPLTNDDLYLMKAGPFGYTGQGFVEMLRVWDEDIATAGIESATT